MWEVKSKFWPDRDQKIEVMKTSKIHPLETKNIHSKQVVNTAPTNTMTTF